MEITNNHLLRLRRWYRWFVWYPVKIKGKWIWFKIIERKRKCYDGERGFNGAWYYIYRRLQLSNYE